MPPAPMGPQEKKIWLAHERQKAEESHKRKLDFQAAGGVGDDGVQVPYYAPLPNKRSRVAKNKSGSGSKQGQGSKKPAKPRAKASFPGLVLPGSAEEARLLGERDPNLDDELGDIPEVLGPLICGMLVAQGSLMRRTCLQLPKMRMIQLMTPNRGRSLGMRQAAAGLSQILATHLRRGALLPKGRATDLLLSHTKTVSTQPARGFNIFIQMDCF
jgi:hypothetical protein